MTEKEIRKKLQLGRSVYEIAILQCFPTALKVIDVEFCTKDIHPLVVRCLEKEVVTPKENTHIEKQLIYGKRVAVCQLLEYAHGKCDIKIDAFISVLREQDMVSLAYFYEDMIERVKSIKNSVHKVQTPQPTREKEKITIKLEGEEIPFQSQTTPDTPIESDGK